MLIPAHFEPFILPALLPSGRQNKGFKVGWRLAFHTPERNFFFRLAQISASFIFCSAKKETKDFFCLFLLVCMPVFSLQKREILLDENNYFFKNIFMLYIYIRRWNQEGRLWRAWASEARGLLQGTSWRRTLGRAILSPTSRASTIWPGTRGRQTYNPWRGCHHFPTTSTSMAPCKTTRLCGFADKDRCAPPARRVVQESMQEHLSCCAGSLEQKPARFYRTHSFHKLLLQSHTRDGTADRGRRRVPDPVVVERTLPRRRSGRILRCQGRCLAAGAGSAA